MQKSTTFTPVASAIIFLIAIVSGLGVGYGIKQIMGSGTSSAGNLITSESASGIGSTGDANKMYKDTAEGLLKEGGIEGEGSFHLERPGGVSQNVYLTSSTVDLSEFIGKKIKVFGQTFQGEKAGWLLDVAKVEVAQ